MHFCCYVLLPQGTKDIDEEVEKAMAPHWVDWNSDSVDGWFDWYKIGGRFTGLLSDYDPRKDPKNIHECRLCSGTGKRDDRLGRERRQKQSERVCNGCQGKGAAVAWPTDWRRFDGDVVQIKTILNDIKYPYAIVDLDGVATRCETWTSGGGVVALKGFDELVKKKLMDAQDHLLVVVDYHN